MIKAYTFLKPKTYTTSQINSSPRKPIMPSPYIASLCLFLTSSPPVDPVRDALSNHSEHMFLWLVACSILTGIGVIFEAPGELNELKRWRKLKRLGKPVGWKVPITFFGLILVIGGIIGEGVFEFLSADAETAIRGHDEQVLGDTIQEAGSAKESAQTAKNAADSANAASTIATDTADKAKGTAEAANMRATSAREEADAFGADIASAKNGAADAVSRLADAEQRLTVATQGEATAEAKLSAIKTPRSLTNTDHLIAAMEPFKGTEFTINSFMDTESSNFALILAKALAAAGWIRKQPAGMNLGVPSLSMTFDKDKEIVPSCIDTGVSIHVPGTLSDAKRYSGAQIVSLPEQLQAGYALYQQLGAFIVPPDEHNVAIGLIDPRLSVGPITICLGKKP